MFVNRFCPSLKFYSTINKLEILQTNSNMASHSDHYRNKEKNEKSSVFNNNERVGWRVPAESSYSSQQSPEYITLPFQTKQWDMIETELLKFGNSCIDFNKSKKEFPDILQRTISRYNPKAKENDFRTFKEYLDSLHSEEYRKLLKSIAYKALQLPTLFRNKKIPLLKRDSSASVDFSEEQLYCLLANAFFSTFLKQDDRFKLTDNNYPVVNFLRLFHGSKYNSKVEKLKCIMNYFNRMSSRACKQTRIIKFSRFHLSEVPNWRQTREPISAVEISMEPMEKSRDHLQVDFANKYIGGGILGNGAAMEEIRFSICPELIVACLFTQMLGGKDALLVEGVEQFSDYQGYSATFKYDGDYKDPVRPPFKTKIVAIDALCFKKDEQHLQYTAEVIDRELTKCVAGFWKRKDPFNADASPIATGNWGCGAFNGDPELKFLIQLLAASIVHRRLKMHTFNDRNQAAMITRVMKHIQSNNWNAGMLYDFITSFPKKFLERRIVVPSMFEGLQKFR